MLEPEVMLSLEEVRAYDGLVRKYLKILHYGFLETIINFSPEEGIFLDIGTGTGHLIYRACQILPQNLFGCGRSFRQYARRSQGKRREGRRF